MDYLILLAGVGVLLAVWILIAELVLWWKGRFRRALGRPVLDMDDGPYSLGDPVRCGFSTEVRSRTPVARIVLGLTCLEWVEWTETEVVLSDGSGPHSERTVTRRETAEVFVRDTVFPIDRVLRPGERIELEAWFELPREGPASFAARHNHIAWAVEYRVHLDDGAVVAGRGAIPVLPECRAPEEH